MEVGDGHGTAGNAVNDSCGLGDSRPFSDGPRCMVDERAVNERRLLADDGEPVVHERRNPEILLVAGPVLVVDRAGVAGQERALVLGKGGADVRKQVRPLGERPFSVIEPGPTLHTRRAGHLLEAKHVGPAVGDPFRQRLEHRSTPGVHRHDPHRIG